MNLTLPPVIDRLRLPMVSTDGKRQMAPRNAPIKTFIAEACDVGPTNKVSAINLYFDLQEWSAKQGFVPCSYKQFLKELPRVTNGAVFDGPGRSRQRVNGRRTHTLYGIQPKGAK